MEKRQESQHQRTTSIIPRLASLRRVPEPCRRMLPLAMVRRYQCLAIGNAGGVLTVAIADQRNRYVLELLSKWTGYTIFPVLVDPARMRLLIRRLERSEQTKHSPLGYTPRPFVHPPRQAQVYSMLMLLSSIC